MAQSVNSSEDNKKRSEENKKRIAELTTANPAPMGNLRAPRTRLEQAPSPTQPAEGTKKSESGSSQQHPSSQAAGRTSFRQRLAALGSRVGHILRAATQINSASMKQYMQAAGGIAALGGIGKAAEQAGQDLANKQTLERLQQLQGQAKLGQLTHAVQQNAQEQAMAQQAAEQAAAEQQQKLQEEQELQRQQQIDELRQRREAAAGQLRQQMARNAARGALTTGAKELAEDALLPNAVGVGLFFPMLVRVGKHLGRKAIGYCLALVITTVVLQPASLFENFFDGEVAGSAQEVVFIHQAHAEQNSGTAPTPPPSAAGDGNTLADIGQGLGNVVGGLATLIVKLLGGIVWLVLYWMGDLMDNTFILDGEIGVKLKSVWIIMRNFVNIFFALALVVVAFMSVIGFGDEGGNYALKKFIPKMALALIAVNFTFLGCKLVLDVNNVITTAIFSIPQSVTTMGDFAAGGSGGMRIYKKFKCFPEGMEVKDLKAAAEKMEKTGVISVLGGVCFADLNSETMALDAAGYSKRNFVWAMATQFQGLHHINKVTQLTSPEFTTLTINALFSIVFAVLYGVAYIAMFIILISRMVVLWLLIMLSPLLAITIAIPDILPEKLSLKTFIDHAFVPAKMAVPLSLGYIMVSQMALAIDTNSIAGQDIDLSQSGEFTRGGSVLSLMYGIASVAVIWLGVFTASENVVGSSLVGKLKDLTSSAGQKISRWPAYLPIVPTSHGLASYSSIKYAVQEAQSALAERQLQKDKAFAAHLGLKNEVGDAIAEIKRVTDKKDFDQKMVAGMATLSRGDQREYLKQNKLVAGTEWGAQGERVGRSMGFDSFSEYQQAVKAGNTTLLREKLAAASSAGGGGGGGPVYETTKEYQNGKLTLDAGNLSTSGKTLFSIESGESGKDIPFELKNLDINKFLNGLGDLSPGDSRNVLSERNRGGVTGLDQFMGSQSFIQQAKGDTKLKDALRKNFILDPQSDEDKATNKWLYARLKAVYGMEYDDKGAEVKARTKKDADFLVELRLLKDAKEALPGWM